MAKHICGQCNKEFETEDQYLDHICEKTGFMPRDPRHLGEEFQAISEAALKRGQERKLEEEKFVNPTDEESIISVVKKVKEQMGQ